MRILILSIVAGLLWLGITETAQAQKSRGGWGGVVNSFANPGNYNQGFYGNQGYYGNGYNNRYYGNGYNNRGYGSGYNNGYYGNGYNNGYYGNGYNNTYYGNGYSTNSNYSYYPSQQVAQPVHSQVPQGEAWIRVILPDPDAELTFDGLKTSAVGRERTFSRNTHDAGDPNSYTYKASASWTQGGRLTSDARMVVARPGQITVVDFTQPAPPEKLAAPVR